MTAIYLENISKIYRLYPNPIGRLKEALCRGRKSFHTPFWALKNISLEVSQGATVGVIGRNGCGKSTLLQLIAGVLQPTAGTIRVQGRISALLELGSGFNPEFTGRENIYMNGAIQGLSEAEITARYEQIVRFADIGEYVNQPVKFYSSGMYLRLAFATAINIDPDILIVDEALAVGDTVFQHRCMHKINEFQEAGKTIFFVSHDTGAIQKLCSEAILLEKGEIICKGSPKEVVDAYHELLFDNDKETEFRENGAAKDSAAVQAHYSEFDKVEKWDNRIGNRKTEITGFSLMDESGRKCLAFRHGNKVRFSILIKCHAHVEMPISGLFIKDLLGNNLIVANSDTEGYFFEPFPDQRMVRIDYVFEMPALKPGHYAISVGVGAGTVEASSAHDWIENIVVFTVENPDVCHGLIKVPMDISHSMLG